MIPGFGTWHFWYLWSGKEDYNRVIKGEGIRFWPVRAFNFMRVLLSFPIVGGFPNRVTVDQLPSFIRRLELGTEYIKTISCFDNSVSY
jgi:hypothetical protein